MEKVQEGKQRQKNYKWTRDKKIIGLILGLITILFFIFSFLKMPFFSSAPDYTLGMLLGYHSILVYLYLIFISARMVFGDKIKIPKWIKLDNKTYLLLSLSIIFISTSTGYYQGHTNSWTKIGHAPTKSVSYWWTEVFTQGGTWTPNNSNGGFLGAFYYLVVGGVLSGGGALAISLSLFFFAIYSLLFESIKGIYKKNISKRKPVKNVKNKNNFSRNKIENTTKDVAAPIEEIAPVFEEEKIKKVESEPLPFDEDVFND